MSLLPFVCVDSISSLYQFDRIDDFLGDGRFAAVYRARRVGPSSEAVQTGESVAIKIIERRTLDSERALKGVINEVEVLKRVHHCNCVRLREVLQSQTEVFIVLDLVEDGGELFSEIVNSSPNGLGEVVAATISKQILQGLRYLHSKCHVAHRDLKPENILLSPRGSCTSSQNVSTLKITIVDFGLAKYIGNGESRKTAVGKPAPAGIERPRILTVYHQGIPSNSMMLSTNCGRKRASSIGSCTSADSFESAPADPNSPMLNTPVGTLKYSAPETVRGILEHGSNPRSTTKGNVLKSDTYSVGVIVYIMLCGKLPFSAKSQAQLAAQMEAGASFANARWDAISQEAKNFVSQLLTSTVDTRMTAEQALAHPWIVNHAQATPADPLESPQHTPRDQLRGSNLPVMTTPTPNHRRYFDDAVQDRAVLGDAFDAILQNEEGVPQQASVRTAPCLHVSQHDSGEAVMCMED